MTRMNRRIKNDSDNEDEQAGRSARARKDYMDVDEKLISLKSQIKKENNALPPDLRNFLEHVNHLHADELKAAIPPSEAKGDMDNKASNREASRGDVHMSEECYAGEGAEGDLGAREGDAAGVCEADSDNNEVFLIPINLNTYKDCWDYILKLIRTLYDATLTAARNKRKFGYLHEQMVQCGRSKKKKALTLKERVTKLEADVKRQEMVIKVKSHRLEKLGNGYLTLCKYLQTSIERGSTVRNTRSTVRNTSDKCLNPAIGLLGTVFGHSYQELRAFRDDTLTKGKAEKMMIQDLFDVLKKWTREIVQAGDLVVDGLPASKVVLRSRQAALLENLFM